MGLLKPKIKGNESEQKIVDILSKPWYKRFDSWLTVTNIVALIVNIILTLK